MNKPDYYNPRIIECVDDNAEQGRVVYSWQKSLWYFAMGLGGIVGGILTFSWDAAVVFIVTTSTTLCFGHSLGMHRLLIHRSYQCPKWLEYFFVHLGVVTGLSGPLSMIKTHDFRDWAQRQRKCHDYFAHRQALLKDAWWQMACDIQLAQSPHFAIEESVQHDPIYQWMEKTWLWQQLPWAIVLFLFGGWSYIFWGICLRVFVSITGHWLIGYFAHNQGHRQWHVNGACVQGYNIPFCGFITMGECWHNNHHAFPQSAKLGLTKHQTDPGWWCLITLEKCGLVWDIKLPEHSSERKELLKLD